MGLEQQLEIPVLTTTVEKVVLWARKSAIWPVTFGLACCAIEMMAMSCSRYDIARFGAEAPRFSPRQADLLWVVGTISQRQAPVLKRIYDQMTDPKWVIAFGTCASCGGFYDNYTTVPGVDKLIPVDIYIPGCPPRPEAVFDGLILLQEKISNGNRDSKMESGWDDAIAYGKAFIEAAPDRVIWGTDWPHPQWRKRMMNDAEEVELLYRYVDGDPVLLKKILVDNPLATYGRMKEDTR